MITRRSFVGALASAGAAAAFGVECCGKPRSPVFGLCSGPENAAKFKGLGFKFIESNAQSILQADKSDAEWQPMFEKLKASPLPILSCNMFLPGKFRLTGEEARQEEALKHAAIQCRRADLVGIPVLVFGSGGARNAPKGFPVEKAKEQFVSFCQKLGDAIRDCKVTVILEPLRQKEANYLNLVEEGIDMVDTIDRPRIQLHADLYHMAMGGEKPDIIRKGGARILHCHVASFKTRQFPGSDKEDYRPWFAAFRDIGYQGVYSCECGWGKKEEREANYAKGLAYLTEQAAGF